MVLLAAGLAANGDEPPPAAAALPAPLIGDPTSSMPPTRQPDKARSCL